MVKNKVVLKAMLVTNVNALRNINFFIIKRLNHLIEQITSKNNIKEADDKARLGKKSKKAIAWHDKHRDEHIVTLSHLLKAGTYKTSSYTKSRIFEPKKRILFKLPYYPDRITHHAILNILEPIWTKIFIKNTYACIKGRGIHQLEKDLQRDLLLYSPKYCLKLDIRKFYPSINQNILKVLIRKKIKDKVLLKILDEIISSTETGVPIGNYLSQFFANLYLAYFDHWAKEVLKCKFYYRYADDITILGNDKEELWTIFNKIKLYMSENLDLVIKDNYQIFPIDNRGIDFVGYKFYTNHVLLRKSIKRKVEKLENKYISHKIPKSLFLIHMQSYFGWLKFCNSKNLLHDLQSKTLIKFSNWDGHRSTVFFLKEHNTKVVDLDTHKKYIKVNFIYKHKPYYCNSTNQKWIHQIEL